MNISKKTSYSVNISCDKDLYKKYYEKVIATHDKNKLDAEFEGVNYMDCGFDLFVPEDVVIPPKSIKLIDMKIKCAVFKIKTVKQESLQSVQFSTPVGYYLYARSSVYKKNIMLVNSVGIIDPGYRGNIKAPFYNVSDSPVTISAGERIVQICMPGLDNNYSVGYAQKLNETKRGSGGFGSTGK